MIKRTFLALALMGSAATAAPQPAQYYLNFENNDSWHKGDYSAGQTEFHLGKEFIYPADDFWEGDVSYYVQFGPVYDTPQDDEHVVSLSGKVGGSASITEKFEVYGEATATFGGPYRGHSTQIGAKYIF